MNIDEIQVWDGVRYRKAIGKVMTANGLKDFYRPIDFKTDFVTTENMNRQTTETLTSMPVSAGSAVIPVRNSTGFLVGQVITITDGVSFENVEILNRNYFSAKNAKENTAFAWARGNEFIEEGSLASDFIPVSVGDNFVCNHTVGQIVFFNADMEYLGAIPNRSQFEVPDENYPYNYTPSTIPDNTVPAYIRISFRGGFLEGGSAEDKKVKLEKGYETTAWTPAPEDLYDDPDNTLTVTVIKKGYPRNSIVARSTAKIDGAFSYGERRTYKIEEV